MSEHDVYESRAPDRHSIHGRGGCGLSSIYLRWVCERIPRDRVSRSQAFCGNVSSKALWTVWWCAWWLESRTRHALTAPDKEGAFFLEKNHP